MASQRWAIFGVGSSFGYDQAGWQVVDALRRLQLVNGHVECLAVPVDLLHVLGHYDWVGIVDACEIDRQREPDLHEEGSRFVSCNRVRIYQWLWPSPELQSTRWSDSHGIGVVQVLELAERLGILPNQLVVFGIERIENAARKSEPSAALRPPLGETELPFVIGVILQELRSALEPETSLTRE